MNPIKLLRSLSEAWASSQYEIEERERDEKAYQAYREEISAIRSKLWTIETQSSRISRPYLDCLFSLILNLFGGRRSTEAWEEWSLFQRILDELKHRGDIDWKEEVKFHKLIGVACGNAFNFESGHFNIRDALVLAIKHSADAAEPVVELTYQLCHHADEWIKTAICRKGLKKKYRFPDGLLVVLFQAKQLLSQIEPCFEKYMREVKGTEIKGAEFSKYFLARIEGVFNALDLSPTDEAELREQLEKAAFYRMIGT
jgi:hypothetical protein